MNKHTLILLFLVLLISCRKEKDEDYPSVNFQSPGVNSIHQVLEPIPFKVNASDETHLEKITVHLLNDAYLNVATSVIHFCDENSETFEGSILTEDIHLTSGTYYLKAVASDGYNEKVAYREIYLNEVPKKLKKIWIVSAASGNSLQLDSISGSSLINAYSLNQDFGGFSVNSYQQLMTVSGGINDALTVLNAEYPSIKFTWDNTNTGSSPFFPFLFESNDKTFVSDRSGKIRSFQKNAVVVDVIDMGNLYSESFCVWNDYLISASVTSTGLQRSIQVYYLSSSSLMQGVISNTQTKKLFLLNTDEIIYFGNESNIGKIQIYSIAGNNFSEPIVFSGGEIHDVCEVSIGNYLIAHSNGVILYQYGNNSQTDLITGTSHQLISYDDLSDVFYTAHGNSLTSYSISPLNLIQNYTSSDSIVGLDILYNK